MAVYVGISDSSKEISGIYVGAEDSVKEVSEGYALKDGEMSQVYKNKGMKVFTSSGVFTVPKGITSVDVFLVGGGGGGGPAMYRDRPGGKDLFYGGSGGGGGYTTTAKNVTVAPEQEISIIVGAGGNFGGWNWNKPGGKSSTLEYNANGGLNAHGWDSRDGSNGGSGGGFGSYDFWSSSGSIVNEHVYACSGGYDGGNFRSNYGGDYPNWTGKGQGTTTRAFGESSGTLYAGGGGGGKAYPSNSNSVTHYIGTGGPGGGANGIEANAISNTGTPGTGGGGGGRSDEKTYSKIWYESDEGEWGYRSNWGGNGGSGVVIIRWGY